LSRVEDDEEDWTELMNLLAPLKRPSLTQTLAFPGRRIAVSFFSAPPSFLASLGVTVAAGGLRARHDPRVHIPVRRGLGTGSKPLDDISPSDLA